MIACARSGRVAGGLLLLTGLAAACTPLSPIGDGGIDGAVLPDLSKFAAIDDIERGVTIHWRRLLDPLTVLGTYGLATVVLAYVFLPMLPTVTNRSWSPSLS